MSYSGRMCSFSLPGSKFVSLFPTNVMTHASNDFLQSLHSLEPHVSTRCLPGLFDDMVPTPEDA